MTAPTSSNGSLRGVIVLLADDGAGPPLAEFFERAPASAGFAYVVLAFRDGWRRESAHALVERATLMPVRTPQGRLHLEPDTTFVVEGNHMLHFDGESLIESPAPSESATRDGVNPALRSLAQSFGARAGVAVLSGSVPYGRLGLRAIADAGGIVVALAPEFARARALPEGALGTRTCAGATHAGALANIATSEIARRVARGSHNDQGEAEDTLLAAIVAAAQETTTGAVLQPVSRRTETLVREAARQGGDETLERYLERLRNEPSTRTALAAALRNADDTLCFESDGFSVLEQICLPTLIANAAAEERALRAWSPGCGEGADAYALAAALHQARDQQGVEVDIQIFATDMDRPALASAARGAIGANHASRFPERLADIVFASPPSTAETSAPVNAKIRSMIAFAPHDTVADPPFTRLDLIMCRTMLQRYRFGAQQKALANFSYGLRTDGILYLGTDDTIGASHDAFEYVDAEHRIYRRSSSRIITPLAMGLAAGRHPMETRKREDNLAPAFRALLTDYAPPGIIVSASHELLYSFGDARDYLRAPAGAASLDICEMVDPALKTPIAAALDQAIRNGRNASFSRIRLQEPPNEGAPVDLAVRPIVGDDGRVHSAFIVLSPSEPSPGEEDGDAPSQTEQLEDELERTRATFEKTIEDLTDTNRNLLWANEELTARNTDLVAAGSGALRERDRHSSLVDDAKILLEEAGVGAIFLDGEDKLRQFTSLAVASFGCGEGDLGATLTTLPAPLELNDVLALASTARDSAGIVETETSDKFGNRVRLRARPIGDADDVAILLMTAVARPQDDEDNGDPKDGPSPMVRARLFEALEEAVDIVALVDIASGEVLFANKTARERLAIEAQSHIGGARISRLTPDWGDRRWRDWLSSIKPGATDSRADVFVIDADGGAHEIDIAANVIADEGGPLALVRSIDNEERAVAIEDLREKTRQLAISNRDLEQVASVVAHDLRAPLRHITQFAAHLEESIGARIDEEATEDLQIIRRSADNLSAMVEALLSYARLGRGTDTFATVQLGDCVEAATALIASDLDAVGGAVTAAPLPSVRGDRALLTQLFQNLLENSIKYVRPGVAPKISVSAHPAHGRIQIAVEDNGIGVDPAHAKKIFRLFHRLHAEREYAGLGVGLSTCRRICELHGGGIDLDTDHTDGARFIVTLPVAETPPT